MSSSEQQYRPDVSAAPSLAAEGLAAISRDRSGNVHLKCKRCGKLTAHPVDDVNEALRHPTLLAPLRLVHDCPDGGIGLLELVGGKLNDAERNREALERMEK